MTLPRTLLFSRKKIMEHDSNTPQRQTPENDPNKNQTQKTLALWAVILLLVLTTVVMFEQQPIAIEDITYTQLLDAVNTNGIAEIGIQENEYTGVFKADYHAGGNFRTLGPQDSSDLIQLLREKSDAKIKFKEPKGPSFWSQFFYFSPFLILAFVMFWVFRSMQAGGGKAFSFGKSKAKMLTENQKRITFKDVAGIDEAKEELQEVVDFLKDPKKFTKLGAKIPRGVLFMGSPGTGKTLLARAVAGEAKVPFFSISGSDFVEMFVGVGASRVRDLFEQGKKNAPCIIFIDEIDAVGRQRGSGLGGGHDEREQTLNQLLVEMDGFETNEGVIIIAATNRPDVLDPALLRPGRFDRRVTVPLPDLTGREAILHIHAAKVPMARNVDLKAIARGTPGFSGADLANLINESALLAARENRKKVDMLHIERAKDKIMMGTERRSLMMDEAEKKTTAYHEAGHALVAKYLKHTDPVYKVTIVPRGRALGVTMQLPEKDHLSYSKDFALDRLAVMMGGRAAEEIIFNHTTTGASNDLEQATDLARKMVCKWGMSARLGPITYGENDEHPFLGRELSHSKNYSEHTAQLIDEEIKNIVNLAYERAKEVLLQNREALQNVTQALMEHEILDGPQIDAIMRGEEMPELHQPAGAEPDDVAEGNPVVESPKESFNSSGKPTLKPDLA